MSELHPSKTARYGNRYAEPITRGRHKDLGPWKEAQEVFCRFCGFACNLGRDSRGINEFVGETVAKGFTIDDHDYDDGHHDTHDYDGTGRSTTALSNELSNRSFEDWTAGDPDNWTLSGSATETTTEGYYDRTDPDLGSTSALITRSGSDISLSQSPSTPANFNNEYLRFKVRVKCTTKEVIRLRVAVDSSDYYSGYNRGQENFEDLFLTVKCPLSVSSLTVYILADNANGSAYIDTTSLLRNGNPTTATIQSGCPMCGSYDYY